MGRRRSARDAASLHVDLLLPKSEVCLDVFMGGGVINHRRGLQPGLPWRLGPIGEGIDHPFRPGARLEARGNKELPEGPKVRRRLICWRGLLIRPSNRIFGQSLHEKGFQGDNKVSTICEQAGKNKGRHPFYQLLVHRLSCSAIPRHLLHDKG